MKNLISKIILIFLVTIITGCASTVDTNKIVEIPAPTIGVTDSIADVQVMEAISGVGCSRKSLSLFNSGDTRFLSANGDEPRSPVDRAKAAAMYNALRDAKKSELGNDILVNPAYNIAIKDPLGFSFLIHDVCVQVKGYRAVVKGFKPAETITTNYVLQGGDTSQTQRQHIRPPERKEGFWFSRFFFGK